MTPDSERRLSRRLFLAHLSACAAGSALAPRAYGRGPDHPVDIAGLTLRTSRPIGEMKAYYADRLGLPVERATETAFTVRAGASRLTFEHDADHDAFYHFAFNIPENRIDSALAWATARGCRFILPPARLNERDRPREIVAFRHWNAHSVFFWDPAGSAVEFIARHDLANATEAPFSIESIDRISEIGLVVDDVPAVAGHLKTALGAKTYVNARPVFEPIGDPHGLLLVMVRGQPMGFGQGRKRDAYPTDVELRSAVRAPVRCAGYPYVLRAAPPPERATTAPATRPERGATTGD